MKKYINNLVLFCAILFLGASCSDNATLTTLTDVQFTASPIASPSNNISLSPDNKYQTAVTISWPKVVYTIDAPVTYAIQLDLATDTIGATAWDKAIRIVVGEDVLSRSFLGAELNAMAKDLGLKVDEPGELVVRIQATLDRAVYSDAIALQMTPFEEVITLTEVYVPGQYQDWDAATSAKLLAIESGVFQGFITFPANQLEFKFAADAEGKLLYGLNAEGNLTLGGETNLSVPTAGTYQITFNLNTVSYTAVAYSWGIIGTATAGGWDADTDMSYDYKNNIWTFSGSLVAGALKFRLNNEWTINYGSANGESGDITDGVVLLDNPGAHGINEAGVYEVKLNMGTNNPKTALYSVKKL